jgi:hypothetical protein
MGFDFSYSKLYSENSITIIGDLDDGYYFNQLVTTLSHNFLIMMADLRHAYQEIRI